MVEQRIKVSGRSVASGAVTPPAFRGVYAIMLDRGEEYLRSWGYDDATAPPPVCVERKPIVWVGMGGSQGGVGARVCHHLFGDSRRSSFRQSCGLLLRRELGLDPVLGQSETHFYFGHTEERLSRWLIERASFVLWPSVRAEAEEREYIRGWAPAINIKGKSNDQFTRRLSSLREQVVRELVRQRGE